MENKQTNLCSFCNIDEIEVEVLVSNTEEDTFICNNCIDNISLYLNKDSTNEHFSTKHTFDEKDVILNIIEQYTSKFSKHSEFKDLILNLEEFYENIFNYIKNNFEEQVEYQSILNDTFYDSNSMLIQFLNSILIHKKIIPEISESDFDTKINTFQDLLSFKPNPDTLILLHEELILELDILKNNYFDLKSKYFSTNIVTEPHIQLTKPSFFKEKLDEYIVGQSNSKKILSIAASSHIKRLHSKLPLPKSNILLVGPTGSGKTLLLKTLSNLLELPLLTIDATGLTAAGYRGNDVQQILSSLYRRSNGVDNQDKIYQTEHGIIFIDEFDKLKSMSNQNINTERVQQELLKMIEGTKMEINVSENEMVEELITIDTSNILFVFGGAFIGLEDITKKRLNNNNKTISFNNKNMKYEEKTNSSEIIKQDLINYGIIPELIGRIQYISELQKLSIKNMLLILSDIKDSPLELYQNSFSLDNINLKFEEEALVCIAEEAHKLNVGGRGIQSILDTVLFDFLYTPEKNNGNLLISLDYVNKKIYNK
jgi:ATP-dependent Clp protease ATP-binding subunit ClpX